MQRSRRCSEIPEDADSRHACAVAGQAAPCAIPADAIHLGATVYFHMVIIPTFPRHLPAASRLEKRAIVLMRAKGPLGMVEEDTLHAV